MDPRSILVSTALLAGCVDAPAAVPPARLLAIEVAPAAPDATRVARLPTFSLRFARPLATPPADGVWLLRGDPSASLRAQAERGVLTSGDASRRVPLELAVDPESGALRATPAEPLPPDERLTLVATSLLRARDGGGVADVDGAPGPTIAGFRVAPARACASLATLRVPLPSGTARALARVVVRFDRPVWSRSGIL